MHNYLGKENYDNFLQFVHLYNNSKPRYIYFYSFQDLMVYLNHL